MLLYAECWILLWYMCRDSAVANPMPCRYSVQQQNLKGDIVFIQQFYKQGINIKKVLDKKNLTLAECSGFFIIIFFFVCFLLC